MSGKNDYETALDMMTEIIGQMRRILEPKDDGLGSDAALKEQVKRLVDEKQMLAQKLNVLAGENDFLEDENEALRAKVDSYDGVSREQAAEVVRLKDDLNRTGIEVSTLRGQLESYERTSAEASKEIDRRTAQVRRYEEQLNMLHEMQQKLEEENNDLELTIGRLKADLEKAEDEKAVLQAKADSYDGVSREQAKEVNRLSEKVKELNEALAIYRVPTPRACPFCGGLAEVHQLRKGEWYVACGNGDCPVNPETNTFDTETDAIEAWNNSYNAPKVTCDWR